MADGLTRRVVHGPAFLVAIRPGTGRSVEKDLLLAKVDNRRSSRRGGVSSQALPRILGYRPSSVSGANVDGTPVEIVVDGWIAGGRDHEVGRFGPTVRGNGEGASLRIGNVEGSCSRTGLLLPLRGGCSMDRRRLLLSAAGLLVATPGLVQAASPPAVGVSVLAGKWTYRSFHNRPGS